jgi:hypothetical protein
MPVCVRVATAGVIEQLPDVADIAQPLLRILLQTALEQSPDARGHAVPARLGLNDRARIDDTSSPSNARRPVSIS